MIKCPGRYEKEGKFGCDYSAGFLHCDHCGIRTMPEDMFDKIAKGIQDEEDKIILEKMK